MCGCLARELRRMADLEETQNGTTDAARRGSLPGSLRELALFFLRLGGTAFGGPAAHIAIMEDELVRRRKWLTREKFLDLLGASNLIPGPSSSELAIHIGYQRAGWAGLVVAGWWFILPATGAVGSPLRSKPGGHRGDCSGALGTRAHRRKDKIYGARWPGFYRSLCFRVAPDSFVADRGLGGFVCQFDHRQPAKGWPRQPRFPGKLAPFCPRTLCPEGRHSGSGGVCWLGRGS